MTGLVRKAAVLAACGVLFGAAFAYAGVPDPFHSTWGARINLVGGDAGTSAADTGPLGALYSVTVRDLAGNPIANSSVVIDFSLAISDTRIGDAASQLYPGVVAQCGTHSVSFITDPTGVASFAVMGGGQNPIGSAHAGGSAKVYADGVLLGPINVGSYDLNGQDGVTLADLSLWSADYFSATDPDRANYDNVGGVDLLDLSTWGGAYFGGASNVSSAAYCP